MFVRWNVGGKTSSRSRGGVRRTGYLRGVSEYLVRLFFFGSLRFFIYSDILPSIFSSRGVLGVS